MAVTAIQLRTSLLEKPDLSQFKRKKPSAPDLLDFKSIDRFAGFGPSILTRQMRSDLDGNPIPEDRLEARKMLRECCPASPGVYGWLDHNLQLVYVGKSKTLQKRLLSYFAKTPSDKKMLRIRQFSGHLVWESVSDELLSLIREQELIFRFRPSFNVQGQPTRRLPGFFHLSTGPAPNAYFARKVTSKSACAFGPISGAGKLREAVVAINHAFRLRDCPDKTKFEFNNQGMLFQNLATAGCIRHELGSCPAPCAGHCSNSEYLTGVAAAQAFLEGKNRSVLDQLANEMKKASEKCAFERAATLRDQWESLAWLDRRLTSLRIAQKKLNGILPIAALPGAKQQERIVWMVLRKGRLIATIPEPDRPDRAIQAKKQIKKLQSRRNIVASDLLEMKLQLIVIAWLRKHPELSQRLMKFNNAISICDQIIDGDSGSS